MENPADRPEMQTKIQACEAHVVRPNLRRRSSRRQAERGGVTEDRDEDRQPGSERGAGGAERKLRDGQWEGRGQMDPRVLRGPKGAELGNRSCRLSPLEGALENQAGP